MGWGKHRREEEEEEDQKLRSADAQTRAAWSAPPAVRSLLPALSFHSTRIVPAQTVSVTACLNFPTGRSDTANYPGGTARALARSLAHSLIYLCVCDHKLVWTLLTSTASSLEPIVARLMSARKVGNVMSCFES